MSETTRFAPSPTGYLHLGHAYAAAFARAAAGPGGRFLLRIEDIDRGRCRPEFDAAILDDLAWLGFAFPAPVRRQSAHFADYQKALDQLSSLNVLYRCRCTRADIARAGEAPQGPDGPLYPGTCRHRALPDDGRPFALRLDSAKAIALTGPLAFDADGRRIGVDPDLLGDVVLARKDTPASYHLAVTVDDALQGVTLVTRGQDLAASTHVHRLLQALLGLPVPRWSFHPLLMDAEGRRLAKRDGAPALRDLRAGGKSPAEIFALLPPLQAGSGL